MANVKKGTVFKRDEEVEWHCLNCGYIHTERRLPRNAQPVSIQEHTMNYTYPITNHK